MKIAALLVHLTAALIFLQLISGGSDLIYSLSLGHAATGYVVVFVALVSMVAVMIAKPRYRALRHSSVAIFVLLLLTGFSSEKSNMFVHYFFAVLAFGVAVASTFYAIRWTRMALPAQTSAVQPAQ